VRRGDGLVLPDRERAVLVGAVPAPLGDERVARNRPHGGRRRGAVDPAREAVDHLLAGVDELVVGASGHALPYHADQAELDSSRA
jgi:hypothetical protein